MSEKRLLLLGGNSDIGMATAREFAAAGWSLHLASRNLVELQKAAADLRVRFKVEVEVSGFDAQDLESHESFWASLSPKPDGVITAFGTMEGDVACITGVNYAGAVSILELAAADLEARGEGFIVGISSVAGDRGRAENYLYGSAKAGLTAYLSGLRQRLFKRGVTVVTVKPGFTRTKMTAHLGLPTLLTSSPEQVARAIHKAVVRRRSVVYVGGIWRMIMLIIVHLPELVFKRVRI